MGTFNAANAVEGLDYNFNPYVDAKGAVPEPSEDQVTTFFARLGTALRDTTGKDVDVSNPDEVARLMANLTKADLDKMSGVMLDAHTDVCGGSPTREQIATLPYRVRQAFYGYLQGWLNPEAAAPATKQ